MRGGSSISAIMTSVMQAVGVVKPPLQPQATNYYSSAAGVDADAAKAALGFDGRPGSGSVMGGYGPSGAKGGYFGRGDYASVGSASGNMSGSSYVSNPGSVSMVNYAGTPYAATGMTHSTFSYLRDDLRQEKFSGTNILHSGQDARTNGFSPNNRVVAKAFAVLDRDDGARREPRNAQLQTFRDRMANDAEIVRLKAERDKATGEARAKLDEQLVARGVAISQETGTRKFLDDAPTAAAREQGRVIEMETIKKVTGANLNLDTRLGAEAARGVTEVQQRQRAETAPSGTPSARNAASPVTQPVLAGRADDLRRAASPVAEAAIMNDFASFDTKPAEPQARAASVTPSSVPDAGQRQVAVAQNGTSDAAKVPAPADAKTVATPAAATPMQTAEAKPVAKPKAPAATMST
jgi:hypothetical protein